MKVHRYVSFILIVLLFLSITNCKKEETRYQELSRIVRDKGDRTAALDLHKKALEFHKKKNYRDSGNLWYQAAKADPSWWKPYYNLACVMALSGDSEKAIGYIHMALTVTYPKSMFNSLKKDKDLDSIRDNSAYRKLINKITGSDPKKLLIGAWEYIEPEFRKGKGLPEKYLSQNGKCLPSNYLLFRFNKSGVMTMSEYSSNQTGTYKVKGEYIHYTITEKEQEGRIVDGKKLGGKEQISEQGNVKIDYISEEFLCCSKENEGTCYIKRKE